MTSEFAPRLEGPRQHSAETQTACPRFLLTTRLYGCRLLFSLPRVRFGNHAKLAKVDSRRRSSKLFARPGTKQTLAIIAIVIALKITPVGRSFDQMRRNKGGVPTSICSLFCLIGIAKYFFSNNSFSCLIQIFM
jgi:hypothetical protein